MTSDLSWLCFIENQSAQWPLTCPHCFIEDKSVKWPWPVHAINYWRPVTTMFCFVTSLCCVLLKTSRRSDLWPVHAVFYWRPVSTVTSDLSMLCLIEDQSAQWPLTCPWCVLLKTSHNNDVLFPDLSMLSLMTASVSVRDNTSASRRRSVPFMMARKTAVDTLSSLPDAVLVTNCSKRQRPQC